MIAVINSCGTNLASVQYALQRLNANFILTNDKATIQKASHLILPGVGAAASAMSKLQQADLIESIKNFSKPILGICLGMQLLYESSQEGNIACLNLIPGEVKKIIAPIVPHMGWNKVEVLHENPLLKYITDSQFFYFVHSYAADINEQTIAVVNYPKPLTAIVNYKNYYGVQFHPERSGPAGQQLLKNFIELRS